MYKLNHMVITQKGQGDALRLKAASPSDLIDPDIFHFKLRCLSAGDFAIAILDSLIDVDCTFMRDGEREPDFVRVNGWPTCKELDPFAK